MTRLHIVPGTSDIANGMVVVARLLTKEQGNAEVVDLADVDRGRISAFDEIWVHGMWLPKERKVCNWALSAGKRLVRMPHGSLSPIYLEHQSKWKKRLASIWERPLLAKCDAIVATCQAEADWIKSYQPKAKIEITNLKRFFKLTGGGGILASDSKKKSSPLHVLFLGRRHPLKGLENLERAVKDMPNVELRIVSNAFGDELEKIWQWADVLVLPTLSENFGLVVAEALERGKRVITTDGAPAWGEGRSGGVGEWVSGGVVNRVERVDRVEGEVSVGYDGRLLYLKGYRDGTREMRVELLKKAIMKFGV